MSSGTDTVLLGRISGLFGVRGWLKVYSYTEPPAAIFDYALWYLGDNASPMRVCHHRKQGRGLVVQLAADDAPPIEDRDVAAALVGLDVRVAREALPSLPDDQVYWADLLGCRVVTRDGVDLGRVDGLMDTGEHPVLVVENDRQRLIPFVRGPVVDSVDTGEGRIVVDWDPEF